MVSVNVASCKMATGKQVFNVKSLLHVVSRYLYILYALFKSCYDIAEPLQSNHVIGNTIYDDDEWANNYALLRFSVIYTIICLKLSGDVRTMQFAILAQSRREMSQTDRIHPRYFLSRVRVSIRPRFFVSPKNRKPLSPAYFDPRCGDKQRNRKRQNRGNSVV